MHEIDLPNGEVLIGRSATCHLTIDDPLVSRNHARLVVTETGATVEDLGSRNGVRVNGRPIQGIAGVSDGSRIRIGTQEVILRKLEAVAAPPRRHRATGFMIHCTSCGWPYATDATECPNCGDKDHGQSEEPTTTTEQAWSIELLVETMRRAQELGRTQDLERLLTQARGVLDNVGVSIDRRRLDQLADAAMRLAVDGGQAEWARWALSLYAKRGLIPRPEMGQRLTSLPPTSRQTVAPAVEDLVNSVRPESIEDGTDEEALALLRSYSAGSGAS